MAVPETTRDVVSYKPAPIQEPDEEKDFGRQMLDTLDRTEHYQHELQEKDLSFRDRIALAYRELEPLMDSPRLLKFVLDAREDRLDQAKIDDFVHETGALHRVGQDSWQKVKDNLQESSKLSGDGFQEFAHEISRQVRWAQYELIDIRLNRGTDLMEEKLESVNKQIEQNALQHLREKSRHHPPEQIHHPDPYVRAAWNKIEDEQLEQLAAQQEGWHLIDQALEKREQAQETFRRDGTLPEWLHPEWFTKDRVEVTPEHRDLGYNHVHNRPVELDGPPEMLEAYLTERMETALQGNDRLNGGENPAQFSRYLLMPYLDPELAEAHTDHNPGERREYETQHPPQDTPLSHARTTYARLVQNCLHDQGMIEAARQDQPALLAETLRDNIATIQRMTQYLREKQEQTQEPNSEWPNWDVRTGDRWKTVLEMSANLTDTKEVITDVLKLQESTAHASIRAEALDPEHPAKYLIIEAALDLKSAKDALDQIDIEQGRHLVDQAIRTGHLDQLTEQFRAEHRGDDFIQEMITQADHHPISMIREYRAQGYDEQMSLDLAEIETEVRTYQTRPTPTQNALDARNAALAGMEPIDAVRIEELAEQNPQRVVLFDQAVRLMAHAGFNLAAVKTDLD